MTFRNIFDTTPLGSIVTFNDGTPKPPARFNKKLRAWEARNSGGRLIRKEERDPSRSYSRDTITLHIGDYGSADLIVMIVNKTFGSETELNFVAGDPMPEGSAAVMNVFRGAFEIVEVFPSIDGALHKRKNGRPGDMYAVAVADATGNLVVVPGA